MQISFALAPLLGAPLAPFRGTSDAIAISRLAIRLALLVAFACFSFAASAQIRSGTITGSVQDSSGAIIPNAEITIANEGTGEVVKATAGVSGVYLAPYLPTGVYSVTASQSGFQTAKRNGLQLASGQSIRADFTLVVGEVATVVDVEGDAIALQTENATVQNRISEQIIRQIPNINHNPLYYAALQPGVVGRASFNDTTNINSFGLGVEGRRFFSAISVNGAQAFSSDVQVDGLSVQGSAWNEAAIIPNQEGLQEVKTITNNYSAEYGRGAGIIQLSTKSGTNEYHGSAIYRSRNEAFNANTFENNARGIQRAPFKVHSYAATVGGPIQKDKFFFFVSYEGLRHNRAVDYLQTVPTAAERIGDFSATRVNVGGLATPLRLYDPRTTRVAGNNVFQRNLIPNADLRNAPGLLDANMVRAFSYYPDPNRTPDDQFGTNNYFSRRAQSFDRNSINSRVDYKLGQHSIYGAFGLNRGGITTPGAWGDESPFYLRGQFIGAENTDDNPYGQIGLTSVLSPTLVADIRYGVTRIFSINKAYPGTDPFDFDQFGIPASIQAITAVPQGPPDIRPGGNLSALGNTGSLYKAEGQTNHNFNGSATWIRGRWTHKFGAEFRSYLSNYDDPEYSMLLSSPVPITREFVNAFGGGVTPAGQVVDASNSGWGPASMLTGFGRIQVTGARNPKPAFAQKYFALFSQNDWKATDRLTIALGLRWDYQPGLTERFDRVRSVDLSATNAFGMRGEWVFPGVDRDERNLYSSQFQNWGPRIGLAYRLWNSTVIRAGYGLTYLPSNTGFFATGGFYGMDAFAATTENSDNVIYGTNPQGAPVGRFNEVNVIIPQLGPDNAAPQLYGNSNFAYFPADDYKNSYLQQWNFTIEHKVARDWLASVGYVGSRGVNLPYARLAVNSTQFVNPSILADCRADFIARNAGGSRCNDPVANPFQPANGPLIPFGGALRNSTVPLLTTLQPFPSISGSGLSATVGSSTYHALQTSIVKSYSGGLTLSANYVWSKTLDIGLSEAQANGFADGVGYSGAGDQLNFANNRSYAATDVPHRFVLSFAYDLPFGGGRQFDLKQKALNAIVGGWRIGGAYVAQSGTPFSLSGASNGSLNGRPNLVPGVPLEVPDELQRWYDSPNNADRTVTLPSGRRMIVCRFCFLKYNPDAFVGQTVGLPNGRLAQDQFWWGNTGLTLNELRQPGLNNFNFSVDRAFAIRENLRLEFSMQSTNLFNHTQFRPTYNGGLGNTQINNNLANGQVPGYGMNDNYGTRSLATFDPRQIEFQLRVKF